MNWFLIVKNYIKYISCLESEAFGTTSNKILKSLNRKLISILSFPITAGAPFPANKLFSNTSNSHHFNMTTDGFSLIPSILSSILSQIESSMFWCWGGVEGNVWWLIEYIRLLYNWAFNYKLFRFEFILVVILTDYLVVLALNWLQLTSPAACMCIKLSLYFISTSFLYSLQY